MRSRREGFGEPSEAIDQTAGAVVQAAIEVHRALGAGFLESVYGEALCVELRARGVPFARQVGLELGYRGQSVGQARLDLLVSDHLIVELKAVDHLLPIHVAQLLGYLKAAQLHLGLLINFNVPVLLRGVKRVIATR